ncbi:MAG: hypothetical protein RSB82_01635 [Victivallaceae bacterium]
MKKVLMVLAIAGCALGLGSCCRVMDCCFDPCTPSCPEMLKCPKSCNSCPKQSSGSQSNDCKNGKCTAPQKNGSQSSSSQQKS